MCAWLPPEATRGVAQHLRGVEVELAVVMVIGGGVPSRVGDDDTVGQHGQGVLDDWHLQSVARRQIPQDPFAHNIHTQTNTHTHTQAHTHTHTHTHRHTQTNTQTHINAERTKPKIRVHLFSSKHS